MKQYNSGMIMMVGGMRNDKKKDNEIINELCRRYGIGYKTAKEIVDYFDNIQEV